MGVRARVAEWPPRGKDPKDSPGDSRHFPGAQSAFKGLQHRLARRALPHSKEAEFQEGLPGAPLRQRSSSEVTLSECDPEETPESRGNSAGSAPGLFREYGSTSSIDIQGIPEQSFFEMLDEFRAKKPGFAGPRAENREEAPQSKEKARRRCPRNDESIFRKLRNSRTDGEPKDAEESRSREPAKTWICRKSFAHFDVQSVLFEAVAAGAAGTQRRNTTTGASAASAGSDPAFSSTEDLNSKENLEQDLGDNTSNELLLSCPHFRNEIGGGAGERDVSFSKAAAPGFSAAPGFLPSPGVFMEYGRPSNAGVSVLEFPKERQRDPERLRNYSVEHADAGARYYRDYFHGK
ncbi:SI1L3 protein, partial [Picathartes gymnocephalus]|nr:SI1L3 protein [Picathartes gymnocephalus]